MSHCNNQSIESSNIQSSVMATHISPSQHRPATQHVSSIPVSANFASDKITIGAGVAIFHLATKSVVVCFHSRDKYWFLPKGRRNASEEAGRAAEREGFEEVRSSSYFMLIFSFEHDRMQTELLYCIP